MAARRLQQIFRSKSVSNNIRGPATPRGIADATQPPQISTHESSFNDPPPPLLPYNKLHRFSHPPCSLHPAYEIFARDRLIVPLSKGRVSKCLFHSKFFFLSLKTRNIVFFNFLPRSWDILLLEKEYDNRDILSFCSLGRNYSKHPSLDSHTWSSRSNVYLDSISTVAARTLSLGFRRKKEGPIEVAFPAGSSISRLAFRAVKDERGTGVGPIDEGVGEQQKPRGTETGTWGGFLLVARFSSCARAKHALSLSTRGLILLSRSSSWNDLTIRPDVEKYRASSSDLSDLLSLCRD